MPSVNFCVAWPDGETVEYYSPSTIIYEYIKVNTSYSLDEFSEKIGTALDMASARVQQKFGYACSAAAEEKAKITLKLTTLRRDYFHKSVTVCSMT